MRSVRRASSRSTPTNTRGLDGAEIPLEHVAVVGVHDARARARAPTVRLYIAAAVRPTAPALAMCVWTMCGLKSRRIAEIRRERGGIARRRERAAQRGHVLDARRRRQQVSHVAFAVAERP